MSQYIDSKNSWVPNTFLRKFIALVNEKQRDINITYDSYKNALQISEKGQTVVLKRKLSERNVNNYNPLYMLAWRANMDIQFCNDNYAIVTYITDYITKADAGQNDLNFGQV